MSLGRPRLVPRDDTASSLYDENKQKLFCRLFVDKILRAVRNHVDQSGEKDWAGWPALVDKITRNQMQDKHDEKVKRHKTPSDNNVLLDDPGEPIDLLKVRFSEEERQRRLPNGLCK
ncbi:hypothetical protein K470DRAFT_273287 [Piedraia hortae CBS 480.64]|uniref:Uncharacterized protein n=1 Tax=Piedraia hortae CBS 480.64 TaxID=1314780 RepID=A0A6A7BQ76_9PEZI|nr:hypothetical protein K470DRAFT_273287 [Piedraia hortae CBS 480.64]